MALLLTDLQQLGETAIEDFDRRVAQSDQRNRIVIEQQAQRLEAKLEQLYAMAATMAKREESLEAVAGIWAQMVSICDRMAKAISQLRGGTAPQLDSYDRILDIRNACEENRALHA